MGRKPKRENRERLLEGAMALLREHAYRELTVERLAKQVRVSKSTLYTHFRGKDELVDALVAHAAAPFDEAVATLPTDGTGRSRVAQLLGGWEAFVERLPRGLLREIHRLPPGARNRVERLQQELDRALESAVDRASARDALVLAPGLTRITLGAAARAVLHRRVDEVQDEPLPVLVDALWT